MAIALIGSRPLRSRALSILPACLVASVISASAQPVKPVASAGANQQAVTGVRVTLDGSGSTSGSSAALTYDWTLVTRPMGSGAVLSGATTVKPTFVPDIPGTYTAKLVVAAGKTKSKPDTVDVIARSNRPPVANAGPDQFVAQQATVQLNGGASTDPDGDALTYSWRLAAKPAGSAAALSSSTAAAPTLVADLSGRYDIELTVNDGLVTSAVDAVRITANTSPVAQAGQAQTVFVNTTVQLNGSGSTDVDGQPLTFAWTFVSRPAGSGAVLSDAASVTPTFLVDRPGTYTIRLIVNDGLVSSTPATVTISTMNSPPVARAGADQSVLRGATVQLDGTGSSDVDGDAITYGWVLTRPAGSSAVLSSSSDARPTFVADVAGSYVATLTVSDGQAISPGDNVSIVSTASNTKPVARAGQPQSVPLGATVHLDGSGSSDIDGDLLTFRWALTSKPQGSVAVLSDTAIFNPTFVADLPGNYVAQLIVSDGTDTSDPVTVMIDTINSVPTASAGADQTVPRGSTVVLDGGVSSDPDGDTLSYRWALITKPAGSNASVLNATSPVASFVADVAGLYVAQLVVNDGKTDSAPDTVSISTQLNPPVANAGVDATGFVGTAVQLDGSGSTDPDGDALTYTWSITIRPSSSLAQLTTTTVVRPSFTPDRVGTYVAQLIVSDGTFTSDPDTVSITVAAGGGTPVADAGPDWAANIGDTVQLDGRASTDPDGDQLSFAWSFVTRPAASLATLAGANTSTPTFVLDAPGEYTAQLIVSDGVHESAPDMVTIRANAPPVAHAGPDQLVPLPSLPAVVQLDGSASTDPDGDALTFQWIFNTRPELSVATLCPGAPSLDDTTCANAKTPRPTFRADKPGVYELQLVVNDGKTNSTSDVVRVKSSNTPPLAAAGPDQRNVPQGTVITLDGSASSDADGDPLSYAWELTVKPALSDAVVIDPTAARPRFVVDRAGRYRARLVVNDGLVDSTADTVDISTPNIAPIANAGPDQSISAGSSISLNGTASSDADNDSLTFQWTLTSKPAGSTATLSAPSSSTPSFIPDVTGPFTFELVVSDGIDSSAPDQVTITATTPGMTMSLVGNTLIGVGRTATLRITIPLPAPGLTVQVSSDQPGVVSVGPPSSVTFGAGQTQAQLTLNGVTGGTSVLHATAAGYTEAALSVTVTPNLISLPVTATVPLGQTLSVPVTIAPAAAPAGGLLVTLSSDNPGVIEIVTPTVTIPAGSFSANATVKGLAPGMGMVLASSSGYAADQSVVTSTAEVDILQSSTSFTPGFPTSIALQLETAGIPTAAPGAGIPVLLSAANPACVAVAASVTIPGGLVNATTPVNYGGTAALPCTTTVTAGGPGLTPDTIIVTVNTNPGITASASGPSTVGAGLQRAVTGFLGFASHGGRSVRIESSDPTVVVLSASPTAVGGAAVTIPVANNQVAFSYYVQGIEGRTGSVTLTATADGFSSGTSTGTVVQPALQLNLSATTTTLSADTSFQVGLGALNAAGTGIGEFQTVRGGSTVTVTVASSNSAVGVLTTLTGTNPVRTVDVATNSSFSPGSVSSGGVAFDPVGSGTTIVTATAPGFATGLPGSAVTVTVSAPGISTNVFGTSLTLGSSLQRNYLARLGGANHNGVTLRIASSNPAIARVAANGTTAGADFIDIPVANGITDVTYYVQGVDGATGSAVLTASANGFTNGTQTVTVLQPAVVFQSLPSSTTTLAADLPFSVGVGLPNPQGTAINEYLPVRGGGSVTVTLTSSTASVGVLTTSTGTDTVRTVSVATNSSFSPGSVQTGGIAFDPIGIGTTTVTASAPGFAVGLPLSAWPVSVTGPGIAMNVFGVSSIVGSSLHRAYMARLGGANHNGVTVRIASSNAAVALISPNATTAGAPFIDVPVANGVTDVQYYVQGVDGASGTATVTASVSGFSNGTQSVTIAQSAVQIFSLPTSTTTLAADTPFTVGVGLPNPQGTGMSEFLPVRGGGSVTVTLTSSVATVGALTTSSGTDAVRTVTIAANNQFSPSSVQSGGVAFDPISSGTTTVTATAPGFAMGLPMSAASVTVSGPGITLNTFGVSTTVGSSLHRQYMARLGGANHNGVTLRIASSNASVALVSRDATTAGTPFIDIPVANGVTDVPYYVQGADGGLGTVTLTATATGFASSTQAFTVVRSLLQIFGLPGSTTTLSPDTSFQVGVGLPDATGTSISEFLPVRGGGSVTATLTSSNGTVGILKASAGSGSTTTAVIGTTLTFATVAFDPLTGGSTTVTATAPGLQSTTGVTVTVSAPDISLNVFDAPTVVGGGLQVQYRARLAAPAPAGGLTVRLESSNAALALVSDGQLTVGAASVNIPVAAGQTDFTYYSRGVAGAVGVFTITGSTPGFTNGVRTGNVVQPAIRIESLQSTVPATQDANVQFRVALGVPNVGNTDLLFTEEAAPGTSLVVTVTNSNRQAAQLFTAAGADQTRTILVPEGETGTRYGASQGGIEFDPLSGGASGLLTEVQASIPGFMSTTAATVFVTVTPN